MARYFGIPTRDITLYPIGGVARLERMSERPWEEFSIALAGPAVNVGLAALLGGFVTLFGGATLPAAGLEPAGLTGFAFHLLLANIALAVFNLLPSFPMDGGRVLRALLATRMSYLRATEIAAGVGLGMALLFVLAALTERLPYSAILLAAFIFFVGQQELFAVRYRAWQRYREPKDVVPADGDVIDVGAQPVDPNFTGYTWDARAHLWVEWRNGRAVQVIPAE